MKKLFLVIIFFVNSYLFAFENIRPFNGVYFTTGNSETQVKWLVSFKYRIWIPYDKNWYFGFNQLSHWDVYDRSSPFRETNYNPSIFWENTVFDSFDFLRLGLWEHCSNGKDKQDSRGYDRSFIESQYSIKGKLDVGIRLKLWYYHGISFHNQKIGECIGNSESEFFIKLKNNGKYLDHEKLYCKWGIGNHYIGNRMFGTKTYVDKPNKGFFEIGVNLRMITESVQPNFYVQWYYGYGEFLLNYNRKTNALRAGFIFNG